MLVPVAIWVMQPILPAAITSGLVLSILAILRAPSRLAISGCMMVVSSSRAATEMPLGHVLHFEADARQQLLGQSGDLDRVASNRPNGRRR